MELSGRWCVWTGKLSAGSQPPSAASGKVKTAQGVYVIGHPCGLPLKYVPDAEVRENAAASFFVANLDTYGGNSGSPVFNAQNNKVEGILVRRGDGFRQQRPVRRFAGVPEYGMPR